MCRLILDAFSFIGFVCVIMVCLLVGALMICWVWAVRSGCGQYLLSFKYNP